MDLEHSPDEHLVPYPTPLYTQLQLLPASSPFMSRDTKYAHARIQEFLPRGGGGGGPGPTAEISSDNVFFIYLFVFLVLNLFYRGCPMVISKETIIFQGFRGGQHFPEGVQLFQGGSKCLFL